MAIAIGRTGYPVKAAVLENLLQEPYSYEFGQVVRILEAVNTKTEALGEGTHPQAEAVSISSHVTFGVMSSDVQSLLPQRRRPPKLVVNFLSLAGVNSPLPPPYAEWLIERLKAKDMALQDFLDIFHHRLASLTHRLNKKTYPALGQGNAVETPFGKTLVNLIGFPTYAAQEQFLSRSQRLLSLTPLVWQRPHSIWGLKQMLTLLLGVPITIHPFQGHWNCAPEDQQTRIGVKGQFHSLGKTALLGRKSWSQGAGIKIVLGPVPWAFYEAMLPGEAGYGLFHKLCRFYCGLMLRFHSVLRLDGKSPRFFPLGKGLRLGHTSWLKGKLQPQGYEVSLFF